MENKSLDECFLDSLTTDGIESTYQEMLVRNVNTSGTKVVLSRGCDQMNGKQFSQNLQNEIKYIQTHCQDDDYHFRPFREVKVVKESHSQKIHGKFNHKKADSLEKSKTDGGKDANYRVLSIACIRDTLLQNLMMDVLSPYLEGEYFSQIDKKSYAYRKGHSTSQAIHCMKHWLDQGYTRVLAGDMEGFFDNINHKLLKLKMKRMFRGEENPILYHLLKSFLAAPRVSEENFSTYEKSQGKIPRIPAETRKKGIPQGGVLSGMLANLFLYDFDCHVSTLERRYDFKYIRYADDFILMFRNKEQIQEVFQELVGFLKKEKLTLHPLDSEKTVVRDLSAVKKETIDFLGFEVSPRFIRMKKKNEANFMEHLSKKINDMKFEGQGPVRPYTFEAKKRSFLIRTARLMEIEMLGQGVKRTKGGLCKGCQGVVEEKNIISYYLAMNDPRQYRDMDRRLIKQVQRNFHRQTGEYLRKSELKSLPSLERNYYKYKKEKFVLASGRLKPCECHWVVNVNDHRVSRLRK